MPRKKKVKRILLSIVALISIGLGGFAVYQHHEKQKMIEIATSKEARKVYEEYLKNKDQAAFTSKGIIQSYEVDKSSLEYNPMGGLMVRIILNEEQSLNIDFNLIDNGDGSYHSTFYTYSPELNELLEENN
ncbi:DUF1310 family protein [Streptococcus chenjunshii]|uniref:DUF1310 family protein n=1 Tax=Streptococcus chenjunshii TaxID=2173853 RepID=A0A346NBH1_9STRE|nr:DUF1310 family protein [Streptococcus chenjunshii]AXQ78366.1 DUF1310 family protein [Streptococcus chenjunshii]RFU49923.1 DUF1310 family protein [Streptococcus chenjunshii]